MSPSTTDEVSTAKSKFIKRGSCVLHVQCLKEDVSGGARIETGEDFSEQMDLVWVTLRTVCEQVELMIIPATM